MLIQITNTCTFGCAHCMQDSTPEPQHMSGGLFRNALVLSRMAKCKFILISGGEPTDHPDWARYIDLACTGNPVQCVGLVTNGKWLGTNKEDIILEKLKRYPLLYVQITNDPRYYPDSTRKDIPAQYKRFSELCAEELGEHHVDTAMSMIDNDHRVMLANEVEHLVALGRAAEIKTLRKVARADKKNTTSCFASALVAAQVNNDLIELISVLERRLKWCHPMIDWRGGMHWSESWLCPSFFTIPDHLLLDKPMFLQIQEAACAWRPCGKCEDFKKVLEHTEPQYVQARKILGITSHQ